MENLRLAAASLSTATRSIFMSHLTIGAVKGAIHSLAILASVPAAVLGIVGLVGFCIEGAAHSSIPLEPTAYDGSIKDVWGDVFGDVTGRRILTAAMRRVPQIVTAELKSSNLKLVITEVRSDKTPCGPLLSASGQTPWRWEQSVCPLRIQSVDSDSGASSIVSGTGCMPPYGADEKSRTSASIDVLKRTVKLSTVRDGYAEPACKRTFHLSPVDARTSVRITSIPRPPRSEGGGTF
jgi:hypothetical protein